MEQVTLKGAYSSPYTLKMRAVLRYRRIPYRWVLRASQWDDLPEAPVPVIPVLGFHDDAGAVTEVMVDSSPQITRLEREFDGRSLVPPDPAVACEILGTEYRQAPFRYQGKCLTWLREAHASLDDASRSAVDGVLAGTGCEQLFAEAENDG